MTNFANPQEDSNILRAVLASGSAALPSVVFANDLTHGLYWTTNGLVLSGLATPVNDGDAANKAYVDGISPSPSFPLLAPDGTAGAPSYAFSSASGAGFYFNSAQAVIATGTDTNGLIITTHGAFLGFGSPTTPDFELSSDGTTLTLQSASQSTVAWDSDATAGNTSMLLWDVDTNALQRVSVGAADSGGTGFKVLRIPN